MATVRETKAGVVVRLGAEDAPAVLAMWNSRLVDSEGARDPHAGTRGSRVGLEVTPRSEAASK